MASTLRQGYDLALLDADVFGARADDAVIGALFEHVAAPAHYTRADEDRSEQRGRNAHEVVRRCMVEVGVREQALLFPHGLVDGLGDRIQLGIAYQLSQLLGPLLDDLVARVAVLVDRVTEAHDLFLALEHAQQAFAGLFRGVETLDQLHGRLVGAAVQRAAQRTDGTGDTGIDVGQG